VEPATGESQSIGGAGNVEHSVASEPEAVAQVFVVLTESAGELNAPFVESLHHGPEESVSEVHEHPRVGGEIRFPGSLHEAFSAILSVQSRNEVLPDSIRPDPPPMKEANVHVREPGKRTTSDCLRQFSR